MAIEISLFSENALLHHFIITGEEAYQDPAEKLDGLGLSDIILGINGSLLGRTLTMSGPSGFGRVLAGYWMV